MNLLVIFVLALTLCSCQTFEMDTIGGFGKSEPVDIYQNVDVDEPFKSGEKMNVAALALDLGSTFPDTKGKVCPVARIFYILAILNPNIFNYHCGWKSDKKQQTLSRGPSILASVEQSDIQSLDRKFYTIGGGFFVKARLEILKELFLMVKYRGTATYTTHNFNFQEGTSIDEPGTYTHLDFGLEFGNDYSLRLSQDNFTNQYNQRLLPGKIYRRQYYSLNIGLKFL